MLNKMFERLGVGGLKVETVVDNHEVRPGGQITGNMIISGGASEWNCDGLIVELQTLCLVKMTDGETVPKMVVMANSAICPGRILPGSEQNMPFVIEVPLTTPVTGGVTRSVITTRLDLEMAVDPTDHDPVTILPTDEMKAVLDSVAAQGFRSCAADAQYQHQRSVPIRQDFDFRPTGELQSRIHELEVSFAQNNETVNVTLTVDRKLDNRGEREAFFTIMKGQTDPEAVSAAVKGAMVTLTR
ncbi:sporulation protein [Paracoccus liaowanqingii]|uniref:sporulation protein n=1 Tax=Paracoccus liaowanqingii TaxID=2560053 RepID=UPI00143DDC36|nr:sporulation protein [Paracoccus liaowanqingii]